MDEEIRHICNGLRIAPENQKEMEECGICTVQRLVSAKERIEKKELFRYKPFFTAALLEALHWIETNPEANIIDDFSETAVDDANLVWGYLNSDMGRPYSKERKRLFERIEARSLLEAIIKKGQREIMASHILRNACGDFDYNSFLDKAIRHFYSLDQQECLETMKLFILAGRTQARKTVVKVVIQSLCGLLKIPLIIITKGVGESIELHAKIVNLSAGTTVKEEHVVVGESL